MKAFAFGFVVMVSCTCPTKPAPVTAATGSGSGATVEPTAPATGCAHERAKVEALYRAEAQQKEPQRVEAAVADNTTMVMNDCAKDPAKFTPCIAAAQTVPDLEKECLVPLDEEGTEGEAK